MSFQNVKNLSNVFAHFNIGVYKKRER